jgi:ABC-type Fe3+/spermidine/putrescine transport system ATPase subunit
LSNAQPSTIDELEGRALASPATEARQRAGAGAGSAAWVERPVTALSVERLGKSFGSVAAINDVSFTVEAGEFVSLLGPSGCGKTTTLRCIAGFEQPDQGRISLGGHVLVDSDTGVFTPPNKRHFGMVFQSYAVWPHMTVFENVAYPLRVKSRFSRSDVQARVQDKLRLVGLVGLEGRYPSQLSGGQQQRVALARALTMEPRALLFDEPLSNLDAKLRERMRFELIEIQSKLGIPAVYVTHDQAEAMVMSRRVIVMDRGSIAQVGRPDEIYARPKTRFVADFIGLSNFIDAEILAETGPNQWRVRCPFGELHCTGEGAQHIGRAVLLVIRPERLQIAASPLPGPNAFSAQLRNRYFLGPHSEYFLDVGGVVLRAQADIDIGHIGGTVHVRVDPADCRVVPHEPPAADLPEGDPGRPRLAVPEVAAAV